MTRAGGQRPRTQGAWLPAGLLLVLGALTLGCGPVEYLGQVSRRARGEIAAAKAAGAPTKAPYEYTKAIQYYRKAKEEAGYADYQAAIRFGRESEKLARKAREVALGAPDEGPRFIAPPDEDPSPVDDDPPPLVDEDAADEPGDKR